MPHERGINRSGSTSDSPQMNEPLSSFRVASPPSINAIPDERASVVRHTDGLLLSAV